MLRFLGKLGKGLATVAGFSTAAATGSALMVIDPSVNEMLTLVLQIITAVGVLIGTFGYGRKAGATINA